MNRKLLRLKESQDFFVIHGFLLQLVKENKLSAEAVMIYLFLVAHAYWDKSKPLFQSLEITRPELRYWTKFSEAKIKKGIEMLKQGGLITERTKQGIHHFH